MKVKIILKYINLYIFFIFKYEILFLWSLSFSCSFINQGANTTSFMWLMNTANGGYTLDFQLHVICHVTICVVDLGITGKLPCIPLNSS